jgi:outer membrane biosynthesis protein TonB
VGSCVVILFMLGLGVHMLRPRMANWLTSKSAHAAPAEPMPMPAVPSSDSAAPLAEKAPAAPPATIPAAVATNQPAVKSAAPVSTPVPKPVAAQASSVTPAPAVVASVTPSNPVANVTNPAGVGASAGTLELKLEVKKKTKVMVNGDGRILVSRVLSPGDTRTYQANDHFDVAARDPAAVRLELNGKVLPPLVPTANRWNVSLTQDSLKKSAGGPH